MCFFLWRSAEYALTLEQALHRGPVMPRASEVLWSLCVWHQKQLLC